MQTIVKTKVELRHREDGRPVWVEVPYEKTVLDDEDKMRIVSEYVQSREPAQKVIERYHLSSKQVLFSWMDKYLHEESLSLPSEQNTNPMANKSPEERIKELEAENRRLEKALELERLRARAYDTMINLAEKIFNIPIRKNLAPNSKSATRAVRRHSPVTAVRAVWLQQAIILQEGRERVC